MNQGYQYGKGAAHKSDDNSTGNAHQKGKCNDDQDQWYAHLHQFLANAFPGDPPAWVREGLAGYFSSFWDYQWSVATFEQMRDGGSLAPARTA